MLFIHKIKLLLKIHCILVLNVNLKFEINQMMNLNHLFFPFLYIMLLILYFLFLLYLLYYLSNHNQVYKNVILLFLNKLKIL